MIAAWFTKQGFQIAVGILALIGIIAGPAAAVQTVRLDGISIFGWHLVDGAIQAKADAENARDAALKNLAIAQGNEKTLTAGINTCNASIDKLHSDGVAATAAAQAAIDEAQKKNATLLANIASLKAIKSTGEKCPVVKSIFETGAQ